MKRMIPVCLFCLLVACSVLGQPARTAAPSVKPGEQWEYLIISMGKVYFADPMTDSETKTSGLSKLVSFSKAGIIIANEAITTQSSIDTLGKFGWELVGVVGQIGGDQEMIFKRQYSAERSKQEAELVKAEGDRLRAAIEDEKKKAVAATPQNVLIDMDEVERIQAREAFRKNEEERLRMAIDSVSQYSPIITSVFSAASSPQDSSVAATVSIDGTNSLITDGNKYRSSQAKQMAKAAAVAYFEAARLKQHYSSSYTTERNPLAYMGGSVKIAVTVVVNFSGEKKTIGTATVSGDWP